MVYWYFLVLRYRSVFWRPCQFQKSDKGDDDKYFCFWGNFQIFAQIILSPPPSINLEMSSDNNTSEWFNVMIKKTAVYSREWVLCTACTSSVHLQAVCQLVGVWELVLQGSSQTIIKLSSIYTTLQLVKYTGLGIIDIFQVLRYLFLDHEIVIVSFMI